MIFSYDVLVCPMATSHIVSSDLFKVLVKDTLI